MNIEKLVAVYLRGHGFRMVTKTPDNTDDAWVQVRQLAAPQPAELPVLWQVPYYLQLDCYVADGDGQPQAAEQADAVARALSELEQADHDEAEVTACRIENAGFHNPDTDLTPARERFIVDVTVYAHPHPA